jgi:hypothetical protein
MMPAPNDTQKGKAQDPGVDADVTRIRKAAESDQHLTSPHASRRPSTPPLTASRTLSVSSCRNQTSPPGAERDTHRDLSLAVGASGEHEVRDVSRRRSTKRSPPAQKSTSSARRISPTISSRSGMTTAPPAFVLLGVLLFEPARNRTHLRLRLLL